MDLEHKLAVAKEELEKTALDKVSHSGEKKHPWSIILLNCTSLIVTFLGSDAPRYSTLLFKVQRESSYFILL